MDEIHNALLSFISRFPDPEEPILTVCTKQVLMWVLGQPNHILLMHLK